jgi:hypothetical protein
MSTFEDHARPLAPADVLRAVFSAKELSTPDDATQIRPVHVINQNGEPRWIIVGLPHKASPVLRSWSPWNLGSRLRWNVVKCAASLELLPMLPGVQRNHAKVGTSYWRENLSLFPDPWTAVIHVGSLSQTRKAILFMIAEDATIRFAAKVPLVREAPEAIFNEAKVLDQLKQFTYLPKVLFRDCERGIAVQSWLAGRPVSRGFTDAHLKLLSTLVSDGTSMRVTDVRTEVVSQLDGVDFPFDRSVLARGLELLDCDRPMQGFVEHRDFAPWNLKWLPDGGLGLLDWEWAVTESLPWQDACRFFYLDDFHFNGPGNVWERITRDPLLMNYTRQFDVPAEALPALTIRYLLRVLPMDWIGGNRARARHTFQQIQFLLATHRRSAWVGFGGGHENTDLINVRNKPA